MASTSADKRARSVAAPVAAWLVLLLSAPLLLWALVLAAVAPLAADASDGGTGAGSDAPTAKHASQPATKPAAKPSRHVLSVRITGVSCVPSAHCSGNPHQVSVHGTLVVQGIGLRPGMEVVFPMIPNAAPSAHVSSVSPAARLRQTSAGLVVEVPKTAHSGHIMVVLGGGRYTSSYGPVYVYAHALHPPAPKDPPPSPVATSITPSTSAFEGQGMWIWYVSASDGGNLASIVAQAHAAGVTTLFVKSSDGPTNFWSQFTPQLVSELHANGLKVCAWQYVYGSEPVGEAALGAEAVADGADCLVIDAETEYEGRYAAAQTYIDELRAKIGPSYPVALASFPYNWDHPSFPYSVFLGPGGAQFNAPQMYWHDIGQSVDTVYANTYIANRIYGRAIFPLGQTFENVAPAELLRFREEAVDYGATGLSFWDWQETGARQWSTLAAPLAPLTSVTPDTSWPELVKGNRDDAVLWMQEHLASAIPSQEVTGVFSAQTVANVESFQSTHGVAPSGVVEAATWAALLATAPVSVAWTGGSAPKD